MIGQATSGPVVHAARCQKCSWSWNGGRPGTKMTPRRRAYYAARNHARRHGHAVEIEFRKMILPRSDP